MVTTPLGGSRWRVVVPGPATWSASRPAPEGLPPITGSRHRGRGESRNGRTPYRCSVGARLSRFEHQAVPGRMIAWPKGGPMNGFLRALKEQRWDDHRFYHHSRINQSLHLVSAMSFVVTYVLLFTKPVAA